MRARIDCARLAAQGSIRINRQATGKPHAKLRVGDVLTVPVHGTVRVLRVANLATRRGPSSEARFLYADLSPRDVGPGDVGPPDASNPRDVSDMSSTSCIVPESTAYRGP